MKPEHDKDKLERFFQGISFLASHPDIIESHSCIRLSYLIYALKEVDPEWYIPPVPETPKAERCGVHTFVTKDKCGCT